ncbi:hypothetical protein Dsin_015195 [Dipteronia sinensis]|uniref:LOB domain-containing protein n=1 Tax=Dipteronia sinensis TaxID=43782 RepID=A0AAE0AAU8_9ROSI|nr:hypothetical protein Dsin_015195 [Dipteronia sinensis]
MNIKSCAVCRFKRKRCSETSIMAPYFPISRTAEYHKSQNVSGVTNIVKMLAAVSPHDRGATVESIIMDGTVSYKDPVLRTLEIVLDLRSQIHSLKNEIVTLRHKLAFLPEREKQPLEASVNIPQIVRV